MVILEHEYQIDNPQNEQKRYVIVPTWEEYKEFLSETMGKRYFILEPIKETVGEWKLEFKYKVLETTYIHEATIVKTKNFYLDGSVFLIDGGEEFLID